MVLLRELLEFGLFGNTAKYFDIDTIRKSGLNFRALKLLRADFDFNIAFAVFGDQVALVDVFASSAVLRCNLLKVHIPWAT